MSASARKDRLRRAIAMGKMLNAGQICLALAYMLMPEDRTDEVVEGLRRSAAAMYPRLIDNPDYAAVINGCHHGRLAAHLEDARAKGALLVEVNPAGDDFAAANTQKLPLTLVLDPADRMTMMQEGFSSRSCRSGPIAGSRRRSPM